MNKLFINSKNILLIISVCSCGILFSSCGGESAGIDYHTKVEIDSLSNKQIKELKLFYDNECQESFDASVQKAVDSIMIVREQQIQQTLQGK